MTETAEIIEHTDGPKLRTKRNAVAISEPRHVAPAAADADPLIHMIERAARDPAVDIDKMERLMLMQERAMAQRAKAAFAAALAELQPDLPVISKRGRIEVREKDSQGRRTGDVQQSTPYALWEDINEGIKPVLGKHGFSLSFRTGLSEDGRIMVTGILRHREGHQEETTIVLQHDSTGSKNAVQAVGSSTSYGKRYTACALLNITARGEDDDGKSAAGPPLVTDEQADQITALLTETKSDVGMFLSWLKAESVSDIPANRFTDALNKLQTKKQRMGASA